MRDSAFSILALGLALWMVPAASAQDEVSGSPYDEVPPIQDRVSPAREPGSWYEPRGDDVGGLEPGSLYDEASPMGRGFRIGTVPP